MGANGVFVLQQNKLPPREIRKKVASETLKVKQNWKRTVDGILAVGCSLLKIKAIERMGEDGNPLKPIGKEISERLYFEPAQLKVTYDSTGTQKH